MLKIIRVTDIDIIETINILIYGEPGAGKTSLGFTADKPILFDFDNGSHRSQFKQDRIRIRDWQEDIVKNYKTINKDLEGFNTIIIDTVETALQCLGAFIIKRNTKYEMARYKLQFYGELKDEFGKFIAILNSMKKDVVLITHVKEKDEGDVRIKRPQITGGTYDKILQISDFVGYLSIKNNKRKLDFNPDEYHIGKNSAKFKEFDVPDFNEKPDYLRDLIVQMKGALGEQALTQKQVLKIVKEQKEKIDKAEKIKELEDLMLDMSKQQPIVKKQLWALIQARALELGYEYHKADKTFYEVKEEEHNEVIGNDD